MAKNPLLAHLIKSSAYVGALVVVSAGLNLAHAQAIKEPGDGVEHIKDAATAVDGFIKQLKSPDANVRAQAAHSLSDYAVDAQAALPALLKSIKDPDPAVRIFVAGAIARIDTSAKSSVPALVTAFQEEKDQNVRGGIIQSLSLLGPKAKPALPTLFAALKDPQDSVRWTAAGAIGNVGPDAAPSAIEPLVAALGDQSENVRSGAVEALGKIGPAAKSAIPNLLKSVKDSDEGVRQFAAIALGRIGNNESVTGLIGMLGAQDWRDRFAAVKALEIIGRPAKAAVPALTKALKDESKQVRVFSTYALVAMGGEASSAVSTLNDVAKNDKDVEVRIAARYAAQKVVARR